MMTPGGNGRPGPEGDALEELAEGLAGPLQENPVQEPPAHERRPRRAPPARPPSEEVLISSGRDGAEGPRLAQAAPSPVSTEPGASGPGLDAGPSEADRELPSPGQRSAILEALLFASAFPVRPGDLQETCGWSLAVLNRDLERLAGELAGRGIELQRVAGAWRLVTSGAAAPYVERLLKVQSRKQLSRAQLEALAVVAYRQPVTRAEVDAYRGVRSERTLHQLEEMRLVREVGRAELPGRPIQYGTTVDFLRYFGLDRLEELPVVERGSVHLRRHSSGPPRPAPTEVLPARDVGPALSALESALEVSELVGEEDPPPSTGELPGPSAGLRRLLDRIRRREDRESREGPAAREEER